MAKRSQKKKRPSMSDVAKLAGVSRTTVSFVLNEVPYSNIPEETQQRVKDAVEQLGYRPNAMARGLRSNKSHTIGFISDEIVTTPTSGQIIQGAQDAAWEYQKLLLLVNTGGNPDIENRAVELMLEHQVEGIIYATMYHHQVTVPELIHEVPVVLADCFSQDRSLPSVVPDEVNGGRMATEILLNKGHRRIAFINNAEVIPATEGRLEGYRQALEAAGLPFDDSLVCAVPSNTFGGRQGANILLQQPTMPTAIFCFSDFIAMGVYQSLKQAGYRIPDDVAIVGFDNYQEIAPKLVPALSTMELPHYKMGKWAIEHLLTLINNPEQETDAPVQHTLECAYIERDSN